jgi:23S rRNA pseudouridine1911/1915/1917 synthase
VQRHLAGPRGLSRSGIQRLVGTGAVTVNGAPARRPAARLALGDVVAVVLQDTADSIAPSALDAGPEVGALDVLFEDDDLLVVVKPAGVVVHPTAATRRGTLVDALLSRAAAHGTGGWTPHLVQRLDRGTSGLLAVAKSGHVHAALQRANDQCSKEYLAVVWGTPNPPRGRLEGRLGRSPLDRRRVMVRDGGAPSVTEYVCVGRAVPPRAGLSLVACRLVTGRTHQIRVHLADRGWPIVGDAVYGQPPRRRLTDVALDRLARGFRRPALHAWRLTLPLPATGRLTRFEAPLPADLASLVTAAGLGRGLARVGVTPRLWRDSAYDDAR